MSHGLYAVEPWADAITANLWRASWQGAIAIAVAWTIVRCHAAMSPRVVSWVWRLVCLKLLVALAWFHPLSLAVLTPERAPSVSTSVALSETFATPSEPLESAVPPEPISQPVLSTAQPSRPVPMSVWFTGLWLAGIGCGMAITFRQWSLVHRLRRTCQPISSDTLDEICRREAARLGIRQIPRLHVTPRADSPLLTGILRPTIVLPTSALHAFEAGELRVLVAHELGHLKRRDLAWNWLATLVGWSFFFHPLVWLLMRRWSEAQEAACDELLLQSQVTRPGEYGRLLVKSVMHWPQGRHSTLVSAGVLGAYHNLERRILSMTRVKPASGRRIAIAGCLLLIVALIGVVPWQLVAREVDGTHDDKATTGSEVSPATDAPAAAPSDDKPEEQQAVEQPVAVSDSSLARPSTAIYVMRPDGSDVRKVTSAAGFTSVGHPRWSHDGKRLLFHGWNRSGGQRQIFLSDAEPTRAPVAGPHGQVADWSHDDKQIAFQLAGYEGIRATAWVANFDGTDRTLVGAGASPRWSPDGRRLAFTDGGLLVVRNLLAGTQTNLMENAWQGIQEGFDWSPDGRQIAFVGRRDGVVGLWIVDTKHPRPRLRLEGNLMGQLAWSPDGKQLAITLDRVIQLLDVEGTQPPRAIPYQVGNSRDPAWTADGKWIAFSSNRDAQRP